jgi:hypothetical protein
MVIVVNGFRDSDDEDLHRYISYWTDTYSYLICFLSENK